MNDASDIAAIVLSGGRSRRMGTDKAALVVDGRAMLDRALDVVTEVGISSVTVAGLSTGHASQRPGVRTVIDPIPFQGPMAGMVSAWRSYDHATVDRPELVIVLACDLPGLTPEVVDGLVTTARRHVGGAIAHDGVRPQPLIAAYTSSSMELFASAFDDGERSVRRCFGELSLGEVRFAPQLLADADTPDDLEGRKVEWPVEPERCCAHR